MITVRFAIPELCRAANIKTTYCKYILIMFAEHDTQTVEFGLSSAATQDGMRPISHAYPKRELVLQHQSAVEIGFLRSGCQSKVSWQLNGTSNPAQRDREQTR